MVSILIQKEVGKDSRTETYAAIKLALKHPLWKDVPIYLRSGKSLVEQWTAIVFSLNQEKHNEITAP